MRECVPYLEFYTGAGARLMVCARTGKIEKDQRFILRAREYWIRNAEKLRQHTLDTEEYRKQKAIAMSERYRICRRTMGVGVIEKNYANYPMPP